MKIGDRCFVHGYIDEIRKDTIIIRNAGGYFGTIPSEVITGELPSAQPERTQERAETHACDLIDREAAADAIYHHLPSVSRTRARTMLHEVPSIRQRRTCVNCGRTINNGGWYADGGTRCPIEEHYALPKDGYCHLWEKRNVTDDDYPERREDERPES